ncbi:hypothetical protein Tco_0461965 [Tanacetum coccineum]
MRDDVTKFQTPSLTFRVSSAVLVLTLFAVLSVSSPNEPNLRVNPPNAIQVVQRHLWLRYGVEGYTKEIVQDYDQRLAMIFSRQMVYTGAEGQVLFTSYAWRRLFEIQGPLVIEFMLEFFSTFRISDAELGLDVADALCFQLGSLREIIDKGDMSDYWTRISSDGDFMRTAPEKVTDTDLFYLRSMDEGMTVNVPYLLAQYLFKHVEGRKRGARMSGGHFVAPGPQRQQVAAARAPEGVKGTPIVDEGVQAIFTPVQAPQAASRTMPQSIMRLEEKVHGLRELG